MHYSNENRRCKNGSTLTLREEYLDLWDRPKINLPLVSVLEVQLLFAFNTATTLATVAFCTAHRLSSVFV